MDRRRFLTLSALAGLAPGPFARTLHADPVAPYHAKLHHPLLRKLLSTPNISFPTLTPTFAAQFAKGAGPIQLVRSESFDDFVAQLGAQSSSGYVLSAFSTIQNLNRIWYFGAFKKGSGAYQFLSTADPAAFSKAFTQFAAGYTMIDFNVAWQQGTLWYTGYWLANAPGVKSAGQTLLLDQDYNTITTNAGTLNDKGMRMTRIQAYPQIEVSRQQDNTIYAALFEPSNASYVFFDDSIVAFQADVANFNTNTLSGIAYDWVDGEMIGSWLNKITPSQFVFNQTWDALTAAAQTASTAGMVLTSMAAYPNAPDFDDYFQANLAPFVEGYAYAVALNGNIVASGGGYARSAVQPMNPRTPFTPASRINLASVSKAITGIALEVLLQQKNMSLDTPFWPLIQSMVPNPHPSVKTVTLRNLATMKSGMVQEDGEGPLGPPSGFSDIWAWLNNYLSQPLVGTPGVTDYYDNTNFTILQGVIDQVSGMDYVAFVTKYVLLPAGINPAIFSATPDAATVATLEYNGAQDTTLGQYSGPIPFVAPGGWISSARELIKILIAMRNTSVLPAAAINEMFNDFIGWDGSVVGNFGTYYTKNGGLGNSAGQSLNTCVVRLAEGYDAVLLANSTAPADVTSLVIGAFDSRGVPLASEPAGAPSITSVVQGASFLPNCAPASYLSIIGANFPGPALLWNPATNLPTELNGVQVTVGGQSAYINYAGPAQINFLLPSTVLPGLQDVIVTMPAGAMQSSVQINSVAPGLFAYTLNGKSYPAALFAGTPIVVAKTGALSSTSRPATAGDNIELYGTGMGPTTPAAPDGVVFSKPYPATSLAAFKVTIGGKAATLSFAGLVGPGLYQLDIQIPPGLTSGDQPVILTVNGIAAQPNLSLTLA